MSNSQYLRIADLPTDLRDRADQFLTAFTNIDLSQDEPMRSLQDAVKDLLQDDNRTTKALDEFCSLGGISIKGIFVDAASLKTLDDFYGCEARPITLVQRNQLDQLNLS